LEVHKLHGNAESLGLTQSGILAAIKKLSRNATERPTNMIHVWITETSFFKKIN